MTDNDAEVLTETMLKLSRDLGDLTFGRVQGVDFDEDLSSVICILSSVEVFRRTVIKTLYEVNIGLDQGQIDELMFLVYDFVESVMQTK